MNQKTMLKGFFQYIIRDIWKEQPIWTLSFMVICAFWASVMWLQSGRLQSDLSGWPLTGIRLVATITAFALPSLFYGLYKWWMRGK